MLWLEQHLDHYPFNKGFSEWIAKDARSSTMEERVLLEQRGERMPRAALLSSDPLRRRKAQKALAYALPGRPLLMFLALYLLRGGFLEGRAGHTFCRLRAWYEFMIDLKYRELLRRERGLPL